MKFVQFETTITQSNKKKINRAPTTNLNTYISIDLYIMIENISNEK